MRVLVLGANGFIGSAICAALLRAKIQVRGLVRDPEKLIHRFPGIEAAKADLRDTCATDSNFWHAALEGVDAVVNAAGVLQPRRVRDAWAVHLDAPDTLYASCERRDIRRIIQVSAVGVEDAATVFARSKLAGDRKLMERDLDWTILRPAIVIGDGSYGGTSMLRAIAACPWFTPVIGDGSDQLDFIHKDDLADAITRILEFGTSKRRVLEPASRERLTLSASLRTYRSWLGLRVRPVVGIPIWCARALARLGDFAKLDPLTTTSLAQFKARLTGDAMEFETATGISARGLTAVLADRPAETQDLWHARLYLIRPLVRLSLAALWLVSGLSGLFGNSADGLAGVGPFADNQALASALVVFSSLVDLAIAAALVIAWRLRLVANLQLLVVIGYTLALTLLYPALWGDLFGSLLKNIPIIALILVHRILEEER